MDSFCFKKNIVANLPCCIHLHQQKLGLCKDGKRLARGVSVYMCLHVLFGGVCKVQKLVYAPYRSLIDLEQASSVCAACRRLMRLVALPHTYRSLSR